MCSRPNFEEICLNTSVPHGGCMDASLSYMSTKKNAFHRFAKYFLGPLDQNFNVANKFYYAVVDR